MMRMNFKTSSCVQWENAIVYMADLWPHRGSRRLHRTHGKLFLLWFVVSKGTIWDLFRQKSKHFVNVTTVQGFRKVFGLLTYFVLYLANEISDKCGPVDDFVPYDPRNNLIYCSTLFMHFEICMPIETTILNNALYEQIYVSPWICWCPECQEQ